MSKDPAELPPLYRVLGITELPDMRDQEAIVEKYSNIVQELFRESTTRRTIENYIALLDNIEKMLEDLDAGNVLRLELKNLEKLLTRVKSGYNVPIFTPKPGCVTKGKRIMPEDKQYILGVLVVAFDYLANSDEFKIETAEQTIGTLFGNRFIFIPECGDNFYTKLHAWRKEFKRSDCKKKRARKVFLQRDMLVEAAIADCEKQIGQDYTVEDVAFMIICLANHAATMSATEDENRRFFALEAKKEEGK